MAKDSLQRFMFEHHAIRGEIVHLDASYQAVLDKQEYPLELKKLLGEMMAAVSLMSATLKFKGKLIAQIQGKGPVNLLVVEGTHDNHLRAIAHWKGELQGLSLSQMVGDGNLVISIVQDNGERYQGIVAISGESLADALTDYLLRSVQVDSDMWLMCDGKAAAGLLIQKLPGEHADADAWNRVQHLSATLTEQELYQLGVEEIIHRLYHEEDVRLFDAFPVSFQCSCSRDRVADMLRSLGQGEINSIIEEQGAIEVACEFCNHKYAFDAVDAEQLFASEVTHVAPPQKQ